MARSELHFQRIIEGALQNGLDGARVDACGELGGFYNSSEERDGGFKTEIAERRDVLEKCDLLSVGGEGSEVA